MSRVWVQSLVGKLRSHKVHGMENSKQKTGMGAQERKKQDVREGQAHKERGNKPRQHPGRLFIPQYSAKKELGEGLAC